MHDLSRLLRPRSVAVVGRRAAEVIRASRWLDYQGAIWPVHPSLDEVEGLRVYRSLDELPSAPDAVFLAVNRHLSVEHVASLARMGTGGVVAYAAGFAESGPEGAALQQALAAAAGGMPVIGPNCYGLLNYLDGAALWPDQHGGRRVERGVAIVTQSGNIGQNITMQHRGLPLAYLITLGNQAVVGLSDAVATLANDPRVTAIGLHVEGIDDAATFAAAILRAREAGKPVVVLKTGHSAAGAQMAVSHTASLAGERAVVDAFLHRLGVARVGSIPVLIETLKLLHAAGPLKGRDIASMSCSGGEAALIADRSEHRRVQLRALNDAERAAVGATLPPLVTISNPLDYHTFSWANHTALVSTFSAMLNCRFDLTALILDYPRGDRCDDADWIVASDALAEASRAVGRPAAVIATMPECLTESRAEALLRAGLVPLLGIDDALAAIEAAADIGTAPPVAPPLTGVAPAARATLLNEAAAKRALAAHGVPVPEGQIARDLLGAVGAAQALGFPVVAKTLGLAHKSEHGAVRLNLRDAAAVAAAAKDLLALGEGLLIERMTTDAVAEVIVGVARDPAIGPYLVVGSGGVLTELVGDRAILMLPASDAEIHAAIEGLRVATLLRGHRGKPPGDIAALVAAVRGVQDYAVANIDHLLELDVNPIIVRPHGVVAVDALIRLAEEPSA